MSAGSPAEDIMQVSVIIPNYNHGPFLKERLESVLQQNFQDFEVIILDDSSTDNSEEVIEQYRNHPKVAQVVYNDMNSGSTFIQWQRGMALAKGEYIWIAESDDVADIHFIEKMLLLLQDNKTGIVYCRTMQVDDAGNELGLNLWPDVLDDTRWTKPYTNTGTDELYNYFLYRNVIVNASSAIVKRDKALPAIEYVLQQKMQYCGDWLFYFNILTSSNISYLPEALNFQRYHAHTTRYNKTTGAELQRITECIDCIKAIATFLNVKINWENEQYNWIYEYASGRALLSRKMTDRLVQKNGSRKTYKAFFKSLLGMWGQ
jgi:glycosyltransferase involved in cell wall biosynthesis